MPRKQAVTPSYEICNSDGAMARLKVTADHRHVELTIIPPVVTENVSRFLFDAVGWRQLCDLRDTLMPKRARKTKETKA